jgi:hypothetical protein
VCRLFIYAVLFWPWMLKLLARAGVVSAPVAVKSQRTKLREWQQQVAQQHGGDGVVIHQCSMVPDVIREEVELFKTDFNRCVTEVLFQSMCCAYYMAFMPICFAEVCLLASFFWLMRCDCFNFFLELLKCEIYLPEVLVISNWQCEVILVIGNNHLK